MRVSFELVRLGVRRSPTLGAVTRASFDSLRPSIFPTRFRIDADERLAAPANDRELRIRGGTHARRFVPDRPRRVEGRAAPADLVPVPIAEDPLRADRREIEARRRDSEMRVR